MSSTRSCSVQVAADVGGEAVIIHRLLAGFLPRIHQRIQLAGTEVIMLLQQFAQALTLHLGHRSVRFHHLKAKGGDGDAQVVGRKIARRVATRQALEEGLDTVEHGSP